VARQAKGRQCGGPRRRGHRQKRQTDRQTDKADGVGDDDGPNGGEGVSTIERKSSFFLLLVGLSTSHSIELATVVRIQGPRLCVATGARGLARCFDVD
jgi:hypothetical protein